MRNLDVKKLEVENPSVARTPTATEPDQVDASLEVWARELPDLDLETEGIVERIYKLERHIDATMRETLDDFELSDDRRGVIIELTTDGKDLWDRAVGVKAEKESIVANALDAQERRQLNDLLRRLMNAFERDHGPLDHKSHEQPHE